MAIIKLGNARSTEMAFTYLSMGIALTRVEANGKKPIGKNWQKDIIQDPSQAVQFKGYNVGLILGTYSGGLTDVDLDCPEAVKLAPHFLPETSWVFGRQSNQRSHYLYLCSGARTMKFRAHAEKEGTVLEIRSTGAQTIAPGSVHPSGEMIRWVSDDWRKSRKPPELKREDLERACSDLSAACLVLKYGWTKGKRDDVAVALCGLMLRSGRKPEEVDAWLEAVADAAGDDELDMRLKAEYQAGRLEEGKRVPGIPSLMGILGEDIAKRIIEWLGIKSLGAVEKLNEEIASVQVGGKTRILIDGGFWSNAESNEVVLMKPHDAAFLFANRGDVTIGSRGKKVPVFEHWRNSPVRREYSRLTFDPSVEGHLNGGREYNLWRGWPIQGEGSQRDCQMFMAHLRDNICSRDEDLCGYVIEWLADAIQNPTVRPGVALVMQGNEGNGKTALAEYILKMYGPYGLISTNSDHLFGKHNMILAKKLMVFSDESSWAGNHHHAAVLNNMITGDKLSFEPKGVDSFSLPSYLRLMMATNNEWAVPAGLTARRFCIIRVSDEPIGDRKFFEALYRERDQGGPQALFKVLQGVKITRDLKDVPMTQARLDNQLLTMARNDPFKDWWMTRLTDGMTTQGSGLWETVIPCERLRRDFEQYLGKRRIGAHFSADSGAVVFTKYLQRVVPQVGMVQRRPDRVRSYKLPDLDTCRKHFASEVLRQPKMKWELPGA